MNVLLVIGDESNVDPEAVAFNTSLNLAPRNSPGVKKNNLLVYDCKKSTAGVSADLAIVAGICNLGDEEHRFRAITGPDQTQKIIDFINYPTEDEAE